MNRQQKEELITTLTETFSRSNAAFLVSYQGLTVGGLQKLRGNLREKGGVLKVAKARLFKRAVSDSGFCDDLVPHLKNQVGVAFSFNDIAGIAKALHEFSKENKELQLVVGCVESVMVDANGVIRIAGLPSRQQLLAMTCGAIKAPLNGIVMVLHMQIMKLLFVLKAAAEKLEEKSE